MIGAQSVAMVARSSLVEDSVMLEGCKKVVRLVGCQSGGDSGYTAYMVV